MTKRKHLKQRVRQRSAKTGESYTAALRRLRSRAEEATVTSEATTLTLNCTFCKKANTEVRKLIAGPGVYICDECIALCNNIIEEEDATGTKPSAAKAPSLEEGLPLERLLWIFGGMADTARTMDHNLAVWAAKLRERGVTTAQLAQAAKLTEADAAERFGT